MERFAIKIDKNLRANLYKICRLCGIDNPDKVKILDDKITVNLDDGEPELWKKVLDCIGLLITKDDKMPQFMCTLCVDKINDFFEFREMCYATDLQTRKLLGIKEEPKAKTPTRAPPGSYKTECKDIKEQYLSPSPQKPGRKRRNADMEVCNTFRQLNSDEIEDVKPTSANTSVYATKKKRLKLDSPQTDINPMFDKDPDRITKVGPASKTTGCNSKLGLAKKRLKIEPTAKEKPAKMSKLMKNKLKIELPPQTTDERKPLSLQMQKKKKALELLKQRKLVKKVAVVKVEKLRKDSVEGKIKEEIPVSVPVTAPTQPKVKLKDKCSICEEGFINKTLLDKHIKTTHVPSVARYHCVHCNETLKKNMEIKNHNLWHKLSKTPFQCGNCSETSYSIYTYSKHIRDCGQVGYLDTHIPDWHCRECAGIFQTTYLFNIHSCVANTLICPGCDRSHQWQEEYFSHIPTCVAAVHRIPSHMSSNIQVKNEAKTPSTPPPQPHTLSQPSATCIAPGQAASQSRITPPLMDSNQCVVIPGNVSLLEESSSPSSKGGGKKSNRITKKDLKRFDKLLKSTMTTLVSIKQEPVQGEPVADSERSISEMRASSESPPDSPSYADDHFYNNDDDEDSANDESQPVGTIKQEIIDEGYRDLYNNIEVNIKRELVVNDQHQSTPKKKSSDPPDIGRQTESITPKPVLKLKITKEHGTLNSILLGSPKSEKKKKKKKRKEEKHKKESTIEGESKVAETPTPDDVEVEPAMPLPEILQIKEELPEHEVAELTEQNATQSSQATPSIVAATSGSLQISCVSEGVHFNGADDERDNESQPMEQSQEHERGDDPMETTAAAEESEEEIDVKPRLEDLIPTLQIFSVSSGLDLPEAETPTPTNDDVSSGKPSTSMPMIVSVSSGSEAAAYQLEHEKHVQESEDSFGKIDNNENLFDYTKVTVKEEVLDPSYSEEHDELSAEDEAEETEATATEKESEESAYIANIDFNNLTIKQEKEYIDEGLDTGASGGQHDYDSSDSDSDSSSSESEGDDSDSDSEREYRDLPLVGDEVSEAPSPQIQISAVHSEFTYPQENKTDSELGVKSSSENKTTENTNLDINHASMQLNDGVTLANPSTGSGQSEDTDMVEHQPPLETNKTLSPLSSSDPPLQDEFGAGPTAVDQSPCVHEPVPGDLEKPTTSEYNANLKTPADGFLWNSNVNHPSTSAGVEVNQVPDTGPLVPSAPDDFFSKMDFDSVDPCESTSLNLDLSALDSEKMDDFSADFPTAENDICSFESESPENLLKSKAATRSAPAESGSCMESNGKAVNQAVIFSATEICSIGSSYESEVITNLINAPENTAVVDTIHLDLSPPTAHITNLINEPENTSIDDTIHQDLRPATAQVSEQVPSPVLNATTSSPGRPHSVESVTALPTTCVTPEHVADLQSEEINPSLISLQSTTCNVHDPVPSPNLSFLSVNDQETPECPSTSVQSAVDTHLPSTIRRTSRHSTDVEKVDCAGDDDLRPFSSIEETESDLTDRMIIDNHEEPSQCSPTFELPPCASTSAEMEGPLQPDNISVSIDLSDILSNSTLQGTIETALPPEPITSEGGQSEINIPTFSTSTSDNVETNFNFSDLSELQNELDTPTAGQLQTLITPTDETLGSASSLATSDPDLSVPILSEEVQNLLNEDTVAANNFELNDSILRARCSTSINAYPPPAAIVSPMPNFTDLENVNEIAENNNNANIERELQDELGNAFAAAIVNRAANDEADDNNAVNENRANFDIT